MIPSLGLLGGFGTVGVCACVLHCMGGRVCVALRGGMGCACVCCTVCGEWCVCVLHCGGNGVCVCVALNGVCMCVSALHCAHHHTPFANKPFN